MFLSQAMYYISPQIYNDILHKTEWMSFKFDIWLNIPTPISLNVVCCIIITLIDLSTAYVHKLEVTGRNDFGSLCNGTAKQS